MCVSRKLRLPRNRPADNLFPRTHHITVLIHLQFVGNLVHFILAVMKSDFMLVFHKDFHSEILFNRRVIRFLMLDLKIASTINKFTQFSYNLNKIIIINNLNESFIENKFV